MIVSNALKSKSNYCFVGGSLAKPENNTPEIHKYNLTVIAWLYTV